MFIPLSHPFFIGSLTFPVKETKFFEKIEFLFGWITAMTEEKTKPFKLVKYFTFTSLIVIFLGTLALSFLNTHWARTMHLEKSEAYALLLVENLNHQVFLQFVIPVALRFGKIQLRKKEQYERMDKVVRSTFHSFKVEMVNIYDVDTNIISYSFDQQMIGKKDVGGEDYRNAVSGITCSRLEPAERPSFFRKMGFFLGFPQKIRMITCAPLRAEKPLSKISSGPVLGVVEIVQDLSEEYRAIFRFQIRVIITCTGVMGILFLVLRSLVNWGERIIETRNLERIRLKERLSRAEHLSSIGEMVAGVSHEIRNPLGIIRSSAELLDKKMKKSDPSNAIPNIILEEANRLNHIITDFLDFAKPRHPNLTVCQLGVLLDKIIQSLLSQTENQNYEIELEKKPGFFPNGPIPPLPEKAGFLFLESLPDIMADPDMIYQAFLNILINAMQAMPAGGKIQIETVSDEESVSIRFKDEGEGIQQAVLGKIGDPFFTTKETGTGLGLGIVKNIIESHGGSIQIENRPEFGAQVTVTLPV